MVRNAGAAVFVMACMAWSSSARADCTSGIAPERLSCLNQELETLKAQSGREIASLKADIQMLRNQVLSLRQIVEGLPPASSIARLDEDVNVLEVEHLIEALKAADKKFEYKIYENEGHGFAKVENQIDAYQRVTDFLKAKVPPADCGCKLTE